MPKKNTTLPSWSSGGSTSGGSSASTSLPSWAQDVINEVEGHGAAKKPAGGFWHTLAHVLKQTPTDLANAAVSTPGGLYDIVNTEQHLLRKTIAHPLADPNDPRYGVNSGKWGKHAHELVHGMEQGAIDTVKHPLRHPGDTLLLAAPVVGQAAKVGDAAALAKAGGSARDVAKAATVGVEPGPRVLRSGDTEVRGSYSRAAGSRAVQKGVDTLLQKGAERHVRIENVLHRRMAKWETRNLRTGDAIARAPGTRVAVLGQKLKPDELRALRLVAEEVPVERRLGAQEMRKGRAKDAKETARHQERIDLTRAAMEHLTTDDAGKPVFKPEATKLRKTYDEIKAASGDREAILKSLDLMDEEALQASKTKTARVAAGARAVRYRTVEEAQQRLAKLDRRENAALDRIARGMFGEIDRGEVNFRNRENARAARQQSGVDRAGRPSGASGSKSTMRRTVTEQMRGEAAKRITQLVEQQPDHPVSRAWLRRSNEIEQLREALNPELFEGVDTTKLGEVKTKGIIGAEDITASPDAIHIGNPVERGRVRGKPKVSSTGTFGHTPKPSSLKVSTGGSVEHALERNDVTNIIAERHAEAARLGKIARVVDKFKGAGDAAPRRPDDVFVWTDKTVSNDRIPAEVRSYLDHPESIAKLSHDEQMSVVDQIKKATFEQHDWRDQEKVAEFETLARQGKGVFVPRRLLGEFAKSDYQLSGIPGVKVADAINNAQKAGLIYLKVNYPVVQGFSNTAMNLVQQGFAFPRNITAAVRLEHRLGPEYAAIVDDLMGQGAVVQAQFEGQGAIARGSQTIAHVMSSKVDTPARRAAWYHEAIEAGFDTPDKMRALIDEEGHAGDLAEVTQRGREAIVDYGDMSPFERQVVRRLIFVYPWQKGATKYAGHFLRDHPVQAAALAQIGEVGQKQSDELLGAVPSYLRGLIPVGGDRVINPAGVNFFQTPAQIGTAVGGLVTGDPAQASAGLGFLAPAPGVVAGLASGHDDIGRPLNGNFAAKLRDLTFAQTPIAALARAAMGSSPVVRAVAGDRTSSKTFPDPNDAYWRFLLNGLYPRRVDTGALNQNAAREKTGR